MSEQTPPPASQLAINLVDQWYFGTNNATMISPTDRTILYQRIAAVVQAERDRHAAELRQAQQETAAIYRATLTEFVAAEEDTDRGQLALCFDDGQIGMWDTYEMSWQEVLVAIMERDDLTTLVSDEWGFDTALKAMQRYKTAKLLLTEEAANVSP